MPANFPATVKTFTTKSNNVDTIDAEHINDIQDEVTAIETLLNGTVAVPARRATTWTPTFVPSVGAFASITYNPASYGYQMRIGGMVFVQGGLAITGFSIGTASGGIRIGGLPTSGVVTGSSVSISIAQNWTTAAPAAGRTNGTQIQLFTNTNLVEVAVANLQTTSNVTFSMFYVYSAT